MSAQPIASPRLHVVPDVETKERFWNLVTMKAYARRAYDYAVSSVKAGFNWARSTLHLDPVLAAGRHVLGFVVDKVKYGYNLLGLSGIVGGLFGAVSTEQGRAMLDATVGAGLRAVGRGLGWLRDKITSGLAHLGAPGRWVSDRITDVDEFFTGNAGKSGLIAKIKGSWKMALAYDNSHRSIYSRALGHIGASMLIGRGLTILKGFGVPTTIVTLLRVAAAIYQGVRLGNLRRDGMAVYEVNAVRTPVVVPATPATPAEPTRNHAQATKEAQQAAAAVVTTEPRNRAERRQAQRISQHA